MIIQEDVSLKQFTTINLGGYAKYFFRCKSEKDIEDCVVFAKAKNVPVFLLGGGSNLVIGDNILPIFCLKMENKGIEILSENNDFVILKVAAGEVWDDLVGFVVKKGYCGIECLSSIPGTVGASPVQNIGAYGQEVANVIDSVRGFNTEKGKFEIISVKDCRFGYRNSVFKNELKGKFIIESVIFKFKKEIPKISDYPKVSEILEEIKKEFSNLSILEQIRKTIQKIRENKLPNPKYIPSAGSFFKNIFVNENKLNELREKYPDILYFQSDQNYKIPSGWLIEKSGLKGVEKNGVGIYPKNALVVINKSAKNTKILLSFVSEIQSKIKEEFSLDLEVEPEIFF